MTTPQREPSSLYFLQLELFRILYHTSPQLSRAWKTLWDTIWDVTGWNWKSARRSHLSSDFVSGFLVRKFGDACNVWPYLAVVFLVLCRCVNFALCLLRLILSVASTNTVLLLTCTCFKQPLAQSIGLNHFHNLSYTTWCWCVCKRISVKNKEQ